MSPETRPPRVVQTAPALSSILTGVVLLAAGTVSAQQFTRADSGWVRLFNGVNFDGFYSRTYNVGGVNAPLVVPPASPYSIEYAGTDTATIRVGTTANQGNIGTIDTTFSHYRLRWESKYDQVNANSNSGMTYHVDESAIRMNNNWPRSIEFQGKQNEIGSAFSIQQVTFSSRTSSTGQGANYVPTGGTVINACEFGCNGRWYRGNPLITPYASATPTVTRWLRFELVARGADSAIHIVNDTTVFRLWNIRIFNDSTKPTGSTNSNSSARSNNTPARPWGSGGLGWQAEGATVRYRRLEVMRIPPNTPMNAHYLHRLFLDAPARGLHGEMANPGAIQFQWRSIGAIPWVRIERKFYSSSEWVVVADSVPNTGSYTWNHPGFIICASPACIYDFRISGPNHVWGDSTVGRTTSLMSGEQAVRAGRVPGLLTARGGALELTALAPYDRAEVRNAAGRLVRSLPASSVSARWNLDEAGGSAVRPGLYFIRTVHAGSVVHAVRVLVP